MVTLMIAQFRAELAWLQRLQKTYRRRAPARNPEYFGEVSR